MLQAEIKEQIVLLLQEKVNPDFIVLFGSFAKGTNHEESDVDLAYFSKQQLSSYERLLNQRVGVFLSKQAFTSL